MQAGPGRFRQCLVRRVADQQVTEPERVVASERRRMWADQLLAHQSGQLSLDLAPAVGRRRARSTAQPMEHLALDRAPFEHLPLVVPAGSSRAASSTWMVGGTTTAPLARERARPSPPGTADCRSPVAIRRARSVAVESAIQLIEQPALSAPSSGSSTIVRRVQLAAAPAGPLVEQLRPGRAEQAELARRATGRRCGRAGPATSARPLEVVDMRQSPAARAASDSSNRRTSRTARSGLRRRPRLRRVRTTRPRGSPSCLSASTSGQNVIPSP